MKLAWEGRALSLIAAFALLACDDRGVPDPPGQGASVVEVAEVDAAPAEIEVHGETPAEETVAEDKIPAPLFPRGLVTQESGVSAGYVLFNPLMSDTTYLVNNGGSIMHRWKSEYSPGGGIYMLPSGNLLRPGRDPERLLFRAGGTGGILQEIDWEGNLVWEWRFSDDAGVQHHDLAPLPNGNLLVLAWEVKSSEEAQRGPACGSNPRAGPLAGLVARDRTDPTQRREDRLGMAQLGSSGPERGPRRRELRRSRRASETHRHQCGVGCARGQRR